MASNALPADKVNASPSKTNEKLQECVVEKPEGLSEKNQNAGKREREEDEAIKEGKPAEESEKNEDHKQEDVTKQEEGEKDGEKQDQAHKPNPKKAKLGVESKVEKVEAKNRKSTDPEHRQEQAAANE